VVRITGEEAAVINVAIGAFLGWGGVTWNQWRTSREARRHARIERGRDAYAALILALDHLYRAWMANETLEPEDLARNMGEVTGRAVREIQRTYVAVMLAGSEEARVKARAAHDAAWELNDRLHGRSENSTGVQDLFSLFDAFTVATNGFVRAAEAECDA
jgi:uncharacterized membrane protein YccC